MESGAKSKKKQGSKNERNVHLRVENANPQKAAKFIEVLARTDSMRQACSESHMDKDTARKFLARNPLLLAEAKLTNPQIIERAAQITATKWAGIEEMALTEMERRMQDPDQLKKMTFNALNFVAGTGHDKVLNTAKKMQEERPPGLTSESVLGVLKLASDLQKELERRGLNAKTIETEVKTEVETEGTNEET